MDPDEKNRLLAHSIKFMKKVVNAAGLTAVSRNFNRYEDFKRLFKGRKRFTNYSKTLQAIVAGKKILRQRMKNALQAMPQELIASKSQRLTEQLLSSPEYQISRNMGIYLSLPKEPNTEKIIQQALAGGRKIFVPQLLSQEYQSVNNLQGNASGMCMRRLSSITQMEQWPLNRWNIREPPPPTGWDQIADQSVEEGGLDLLIVPGLAFTRLGDRLGRGGGYYDRYLSWYRIKSRSSHLHYPVLLSLTFEEQIVDELPVEPHDIKVDCVISA
ncbi:hypothetical protein T265_09967 [Opisthorchis viverrini]|uniref:5-formyltetrahydrofolate cyclo-ligase n=1 Tax=Opisthorchis viverrini TaxID=6198 RepID=A0A074Z898_OPIVI|nr:hypothetical protein T265_09967 [Opisthorchis viverrini]KER21782.1 hypothetical protein T265_09967 [Opisthorchis viverrini]